MTKDRHKGQLRRAYGRALLSALKDQGWTTSMGGKHVVFTAPDGTKVFGSATPSDNRAVLNITAKLRRAGLTID